MRTGLFQLLVPEGTVHGQGESMGVFLGCLECGWIVMNLSGPANRELGPEMATIALKWEIP